MTEPRVELVDVVDEADRVVATVPRATMRRDRLLHRAVYVAVVDPDGRLLVHRRSDAKDVWPGRWDLAVGGVVGAGEDWDAAAARELAEEVGVVDVAPEPLSPATFLYEDADLRALGRCYRVVTAGPFTFADGEVVEARWIAAADLAGFIEEHELVPDSPVILLPLLETD